MLENMKVAIIGPGVMGEAIFSGLISSKSCPGKNIVISGPELDRNEILKAQYGVSSTDNNAEAVKNADIVVLAVKPQRFKMVANSVRGSIPPNALVISIVAGIKIDPLCRGWGTNW
jgi:pyrroline-5-carboxylate reductase